MKNLVIKIGTNVLTQESGLLDLNVIDNITRQVSELCQAGHSVTIISSGAMGAGRSIIELHPKASDVTKRQLLAAVGQVELMSTYSSMFAKHGFKCAQVLATKDDFRDRTHYLNMKNCFEEMTKHQVIPIVNENDVVSVSELMFTDNDELASLVASMINADALIILTNVDGIFDKDPSESDAKIIHEVTVSANLEKYISPRKSSFGRGGMLTKANMAQKLASVGITTHIINGKSKSSLTDALADKQVGTKFVPKDKKVSPVKKWIAYSSGHEKGAIYINDCAEELLTSKEKVVSLLPIGITKIEGQFSKGDIITIKNSQGKQLGIGKAAYDSQKAQANLGLKGKKALIHYDHLYLS